MRLRGMGAELRFFVKVAESGTCWDWNGSRNPKGYGNFRDATGRIVQAHRWSWEHFHGPIPVGLEVDHLCFNRACVNPDHMDLVTRAVNVDRGRHNQWHGVTECIRGHVYDEANTYTDKRGRRSCRTCRREDARQRRQGAAA